MKTTALVLATAVILGVLGAGCASTGPYPRDFFIEMHYQQSYRAQEPPRLQPAPLAVPITGREVDPGTFQDALDLPNQVPAGAATRAQATVLFAANCALCHGPQGRGDSVMAQLFRSSNAPPPADLASQRVQDRTSGELYWILTKGLGAMPPFGKLLTADERWTLVHYIEGVGP